MTREEAIKEQESLLAYWESGEDMVTKRAVDALRWSIEALYALRPVIREQVEKVWKGEWKCQSDCGVTECTACKWNIEEYCGDYNFCPHCGAPMNDEAIQMVMDRMKELK